MWSFCIHKNRFITQADGEGWFKITDATTQLSHLYGFTTSEVETSLCIGDHQLRANDVAHEYPDFHSRWNIISK
jgi:hypothetical protein